MASFSSIVSNLLNTLFSNGGQGTSSRALTTSAHKPNNDYSGTIQTDRKKAARLYYNTDQNYALAAQLVKPIINNNVNFIGKPTLRGNKKTVKVIEEVKPDYTRIHKAVEIAGTVGVWPQWHNKKNKIELILIPLDVIQEVFIDPITKEITGYKLKESITYANEHSSHVTVQITHIITAKEVVMIMTGDVAKTTRVANPFNRVPITLFTNDKDISDLYGHSEIEAIEPQLKFYHDLTFEAGTAQSRDGHPKLKVSTSNPQRWIDNNFGAGMFAKISAGKAALNLDDRDLYLNQGDDDVNYIYLNKTSGDYQQLSENTFTNIVEGSETPEINFGANIGTSLASVKEQRPVWIKKIEAKQEERTPQWLDLFDIIIDIYNFVNFKNLKNDIELNWPKPNFVSAIDQATIMDSLAKAFDKMVTKRLISQEEVYNTLSKLDLFELIDTYEKHKEAVDEDYEKEVETADAGDEEASDEGAEETAEDNNEGVEEGNSNS